MRTNLTSQITLNHVNTSYYKPKNAFEQAQLTRLEKVPTYIYENADEASQQIAREIADTIRQKEAAYKPCVMVLTGGATPRQLYAELVRMHREEALSFRNVIVFNLYEFYPLAEDTVFSNLKALKDMLLDHVDIDPKRTHVPDGLHTTPENAADYDKMIGAAGGIDLLLLGIGANGHIGFNEPGSSFDTLTHIADLDESTRQANARFFASPEEVPAQAVTMGIHTIMQARSIILMAFGANKAQAVAAAVTGPVSSDVPASVLRLHPDVTIYADDEAAAGIKV